MENSENCNFLNKQFTIEINNNYVELTVSNNNLTTLNCYNT